MRTVTLMSCSHVSEWYFGAIVVDGMVVFVAHFAARGYHLTDIWCAPTTSGGTRGLTLNLPDTMRRASAREWWSQRETRYLLR
jgi:hypothetical protein